MTDSETHGQKHVSELKDSARELNQALERLDLSTFGESEKRVIGKTVAGSRELFQKMEEFINTVVDDLEETEERLKKGSGALLKQAVEQLDKVTESTQNAVESVLNRIDTICARQDDIFQQISSLRDGLSGEGDDKSSQEDLMGFLEKVESLEGEIQMEAFEIMNEMQFQDITTQQIQLAGQLIEEAKGKLMDFRKVLALFGDIGAADRDGDNRQRVYDPGATMEGREERQSLADNVASQFEKKKKQ